MSDDLPPSLAAIQYERDFDINGILRKIVKSLQEKGVMVSGVLQEAEFRPNGCCARLNIVDIRTGKTERITQDRGRESRGCKLDPRGLATISHCIADAIDADVDLVIINKFGRAESEGDGLLFCIADAISAGVPISHNCKRAICRRLEIVSRRVGDRSAAANRYDPSMV
jgi:nucleoside-triphosphatase THEP1